MLDKKGRSKGYGYVDMDSDEALTEAISLNGTKIENRAIKVARSKPTSKRVRPVVQAPRLPSEPVSRCVLFLTSSPPPPPGTSLSLARACVFLLLCFECRCTCAELRCSRSYSRTALFVPRNFQTRALAKKDAVAETSGEATGQHSDAEGKKPPRKSNDDFRAMFLSRQ